MRRQAPFLVDSVVRIISTRRYSLVNRNYKFEKRQRDLAKKKKKEEKQKRKEEKKRLSAQKGEDAADDLLETNEE